MRNLNFRFLVITLTLGLFLLLPSSSPGKFRNPQREELQQAVKNLTHKDPKEREAALDQLLASSYRDPSLGPVLEPLLEDPSARVREQAVSLIGEVGAKESIQQILPLLQDPVVKVRIAATQTLGQLNAQQAIPSITFLLNDDNEDVV